jgi:glucosamine--fructose-6-phosphate aminotransferase (isomerizing)
MRHHLTEQQSRRAQVLLSHLSPNQSSIQQHHHSTISPSPTCGIIAFISKEEPAFNYLMEGLTILQSRGYDSAGICTLETPASSNEESKIVVSKYASLNTTSDALKRLETAFDIHKSHTIGIAHTRWATHGGKTDNNAHPHTDTQNRIALVHNGVIENSTELKKVLIEKHHVKFRSETDTEVIVQLISVIYDQLNAKRSDTKEDLFIEAIQRTLNQLEGTWGLVIVSTLDSDKPRLIAVRNGSPLLLGLSKGRMFVASESSAFSRHTREMIALENNEIAVVSADGVDHFIKKKSKTSDLGNRVELSEDVEIKLTPAPFKHWTIKEIMEQPEAVSRSLNFGGRFATDVSVKLGGLDANLNLLLGIKHLIIAACGTSYFAGQYGAKMMRILRCFETVRVVDAAELDVDDFPTEDAGLLVITQSGETSDVVRCLGIAEELNVPSFSIVNKVGSLVARTTSCGVYINAGREHAVASTKAFSCQVTVLSLVALWFAQVKSPKSLIQQRQALVASLHRLPTSVGMLNNKVHQECTKIANRLKDCHDLFILGKGFGESIAYEGSLKIKEITYTHAEGYSSGALKHGPFALIEEGTPIFIVILNDKYMSLNLTAAHEVKARGAQVYAITDIPSKAAEVCHHIIEIPHNGLLTALLAIVPLQLIAYELAVLRGIDPDLPRNLAKSVTVQ